MEPLASIHLTRDVQATAIPSGSPFTMEKGTEVVITQSLGGSYTVSSKYGLSRIEDKDRDALGMEAAAPESGPAVDHQGPPDEKAVWDKLKMVYDPEIPVNIVDLGLVYHMGVVARDDGKFKVEVKMTLTAPGCGMGPTIQADAKSKVETVPGVSEADVQLVWEPAWNQGMISEAGRMKLGLV
jgi:probable FeS assembly SUF system protein SufT